MRRWELTDHLCRFCGGRVLRCVAGAGATPGGNPVWMCADCEHSSADLSPACICWCGFAHRGSTDTAYQCVPFSALKDKPWLLPALRACGCDPDSRTSRVGIVLVTEYVRLRKENE